MLALLGLHTLAALTAPLWIRAMGRRAFYVLALPCLITLGWALTHRPSAQGASVEYLNWVPSLGIELSFRLDTLSWLMVLIVAGIGALVLCYCAGYFDDDEPALGRFAAHLTGFVAAMFGLVTSDDLLMLYLFWEATTVLSYLLVGHKSTAEDSRNAATQALVVTTFGGLTMLVGMILLGQSVGTYRISELLAAPPTGPLASVAIVLVLVGAISKSALVPFHFWLPGAMAAPTPVSAYLHAAAMVKAGIYLVARFAPGFSSAPTWQPTVLVLGGLTMLVGGYRALRQHDLKLLLAYGTVSQLGFLTVLVGTGSREAALAGLTMLIAHALFKAGLFLTVGTIDHATGTRDLRKLSGLRPKMPVLFVASVLCAASMSGVPPMLGFVGKEAAYATFQHGLEGGLLADSRLSTLVLVVLIVGSALTFAYSARFVWGAWRRIPGAEDTPMHRVGAVAWVVPAILAAASLIAAFFSKAAEPLLRPYTDQWPAGAYPVSLGLWHGVNLTLVLSLATLAAGALLFIARRPVQTLQQELPHPPAAVSAYRMLMRGLDRLSLEVTGFSQRGSLPLTLGLILTVLIVLPGGSLVMGRHEIRTLGWESPAQLAVAVLTGLAAVFAVRSRRRFRGVFLVGVTGYGCAVLFLLHGAPDLALTQTLVETVSIVLFVLVLRRFTGRFNDSHTVLSRTVRTVIGVLAGLTMTGIALVAATARTAPPSSVDLAEGAATFGGGENIVNVILVDVRAWDTMGEISVVLVAATGIASLIFLRGDRLDVATTKVAEMRRRRGGHHRSDRGSFLAEGAQIVGQRRSFIFEIVARIIFHTVMVWSLYLLFAGHNLPGGGFAAGLVAGLALIVRYLAGGRDELRAALPVMPGPLLGTGLFIAVFFGLASMLAGGEVLESWTLDFHLPVLGDIHLVTSVFFDIGVYLVVIGLMLDVLRNLGSALDSQIEAEREAEDDGTAPTLTTTAASAASSEGPAQ